MTIKNDISEDCGGIFDRFVFVYPLNDNDLENPEDLDALVVTNPAQGYFIFRKSKEINDLVCWCRSKKDAIEVCESYVEREKDRVNKANL